jgi:hypothetical protein
MEREANSFAAARREVPESNLVPPVARDLKGKVFDVLSKCLPSPFSGLESSVWAFASAVAMAATLSLDRCRHGVE